MILSCVRSVGKKKRDGSPEQRVTRYDVDGHLWKGRVGVKHTEKYSKNNSLFPGEEKKTSDSEATGGRSSRRD